MCYEGCFVNFSSGQFAEAVEHIDCVIAADPVETDWNIHSVDYYFAVKPVDCTDVWHANQLMDSGFDAAFGTDCYVYFVDFNYSQDRFALNDQSGLQNYNY